MNRAHFLMLTFLFWASWLFSLQTFNSEDLCVAYKYLANYHINQNNIEEAYTAAQKCTEFNEVNTKEKQEGGGGEAEI